MRARSVCTRPPVLAQRITYVGELDVEVRRRPGLALELGLDQVGPAGRGRQLAPFHVLGVVAEAERAEVKPHGPVVRTVRLALRRVAELWQHRRLVGFGNALPSAACRCGSPVPPNHTSPCGLSFWAWYAGIDLARAHACHIDLDAGILLVRCSHRTAPVPVNAAIHHELTLRLRHTGREHQREDGGRPARWRLMQSDMLICPLTAPVCSNLVNQESVPERAIMLRPRIAPR